MTTKTYAELTAATDFEATDLLAAWRPSGPGPLKSLTGNVLLNFLNGYYLPLSGGTLTGVLLFAAGAQSLPGLAPAGDPDTGFYSVSANVLGLSCGGAQVAAWSMTGQSVTGALAVSGAITSPTITAASTSLSTLSSGLSNANTSISQISSSLSSTNSTLSVVSSAGGGSANVSTSLTNVSSSLANVSTSTSQISSSLSSTNSTNVTQSTSLSQISSSLSSTTSTTVTQSTSLSQISSSLSSTNSTNVTQSTSLSQISSSLSSTNSTVSALSTSGSVFPVVTKSSSFTTVLGDAQTAMTLAINTAVTVDCSLAYPLGTTMEFYALATGCSVNLSGGNTLLWGTASSSGRNLSGLGSVISIKKILSNNTWFVTFSQSIT